MDSESKPLEELLKELLPESRAKVRNLVEFLLEKRCKSNNTGGRLRQHWAGGLSDYRDQYTSLELQQNALEWRGD
jgi:hypothetical protein